MLEVSIAAVVIAVVGWDAFRRHLAMCQRHNATLDQLKGFSDRLNNMAGHLDEHGKKLGKVKTDLGAMNMTTPTGRTRR